MVLVQIGSNPSSWGNIRSTINANTGETEQRLQFLEVASSIISGEGAPSNSIGNNKDYYINKSDYSLWFKDNGVWATDTTLIGPPGLVRRGDWNGVFAYAYRDAVMHNGRFWYAKRANTGVEPTTLATDDWELIAPSMRYRGTWSNVTVYETSDLVLYRGSLWTSKQRHSGQEPTTDNSAYWDKVTFGWNSVAVWAAGTVYRVGDIVLHDGSSYQVITNHTSTATTPNNDTTNYTKIVSKGDTGAQGIQGVQGIQGNTGPKGDQGIQGVPGTNAVPRGNWSSTFAYTKDDLALYGGALWRALRSNTNVTPVEGADWTEFLPAGIPGPQGEQGIQGIQGEQGIQGVPGAKGDTGPAGPGLPAGGSAKQIVRKIDGVDYNTAWSNLPSLEQAFSRAGVLVVGAVAPRWFITRAIIITGISLSVNTPSAGASIIVDLNRATSGAPASMSTLYTTQANRPTLAPGAYGLLNGVLPDIVSIPAGDFLQMEIDAIGTTTVGSDITMFIRYDVV